ncbi:MAG: hypothetical protein KTR33_14685 [Gammaproteobacteria bacterium]|nr:hypothetical protein [Gammaproteobacteria bacterium]
MFFRMLAVAALVTSVGCSSGGDDDGTPNPDPNPGPGGATTGVWLGNTTFGESVFVIDGNENLFGFSGNNGQYETVFGSATGTADLEVFAHRESDDTTLGDSITVVGDPKETRDYNLATANDGQSLTNTGDAGSFSLTLADANDMPDVTIAGVVGTWVARTGIDDGAGGANSLVVTITIAADGGVTGSTQFAEFDPLPLTGSVISRGQYLALTFTWNSLTRNGVAYIDRTTSRLIINTFGVESAAEGNRSFSADMVRQ